MAMQKWREGFSAGASDVRMLFHLSRAEAALDGDIIENDCVDRKKIVRFQIYSD